ncbi:MAG: glycerate kinase, partial [Ignavibacteriaceae bacterium]|nr:glycerate kinase [Ignavibacteriaceae bacterium]
MKNILLAFNSFKEVADSVEICDLMNDNLRGEVECILLPISDGGDGFLEVCKFFFKLECLTYCIKNFYNELIFRLLVGIKKKSATAYIEVASAIGLNLIPFQERNPNLYNSKA